MKGKSDSDYVTQERKCKEVRRDEGRKGNETGLGKKGRIVLIIKQKLKRIASKVSDNNDSKEFTVIRVKKINTEKSTWQIIFKGAVLGEDDTQKVKKWIMKMLVTNTFYKCSW